MSDRHDAGLVTGALEAAVAARGQGKLPGTIFHTDRGAEYTAAACANACERLGLRQSMGRTGSCLDNAAAESFFATLKVELVSRRRYRTRARRAPRSSPGSPGTTDAGCTRPSATCPQSSGSSVTPPSTRHRPRWPHNPSVRPPGGSPSVTAQVDTGGTDGSLQIDLQRSDLASKAEQDEGEYTLRLVRMLLIAPGAGQIPDTDGHFHLHD
jgi:hypothetical protein